MQAYRAAIIKPFSFIIWLNVRQVDQIIMYEKLTKPATAYLRFAFSLIAQRFWDDTSSERFTAKTRRTEHMKTNFVCVRLLNYMKRKTKLTVKYCDNASEHLGCTKDRKYEEKKNGNNNNDDDSVTRTNKRKYTAIPIKILE